MIRQFKAMGSQFLLRLDPKSGDVPAEQNLKAILKRLSDEIMRLELVMSRFRPDSELMRLNQSLGEFVRISDEMASVLRIAQKSYVLTHGVFDPRVLSSLEDLGYGGAPLPSHEFIEQNKTRGRDVRKRTGALFTWRDSNTVKVSESIDLGGIGKGYTADAVAEWIEQFCPDQLSGYIVNAGGDMVVKGVQHSGEPWSIGIEDPFKPEHLIAVLSPAHNQTAVCTSAVWKRSWVTQGRRVHHLIDPKTGTSAHTGIVAVTVLADNATIAETITKYILITGGVSGIQVPIDLSYLIIYEDQSVAMSPSMVNRVTWLDREQLAQIEIR